MAKAVLREASSDALDVPPQLGDIIEDPELEESWANAHDIDSRASHESLGFVFLILDMLTLDS